MSSTCCIGAISRTWIRGVVTGSIFIEDSGKGSEINVDHQPIDCVRTGGATIHEVALHHVRIGGISVEHSALHPSQFIVL
jgi:hypothetical protein